MSETPPNKSTPRIELVPGPLSPRAGPVGPVPIRSGTSRSLLVTPPKGAATGAASTPSPAGLSNTRRVVGLIFLLAAAMLVCVAPQTWNGWVDSARAMWRSTGSSIDQGPQKPLADAPEEDQTEADSVGQVDMLGVRVALVTLCVFGVLLLHGSRSIWFLIYLPITAALIGLTALDTSLLLGTPLPWRTMVYGALAVAYLIQTARRPSQLSLLGMVGLVLVALAGIGELKGWYGCAWAWAGSKTGSGPMRFVADWGTELVWATTLFLATLGALWSRTKPIHFLIAVLVGALAYHCADSGRVIVRTFEKTPSGELVKVMAPTQSASVPAPNQKLIKIDDVNFSNVPPWRWVAAGELTVIALVLLYKALGMGALSVTFALAWMILGGYAYESVRSASFAGPAYNYFIRPTLTAGTAGRTTAPTSTPGVIEGLELPLNPTGSSQRTGPGAGPHATRPPATSRLPSSPVSRTQSDRPPSGVAPGASAMPPELALKIGRRELGLTAWIYVTAILAGVIGVTGLHLLWGGPGYRFWLTIALWVGLAVACSTLWFTDPREPSQSWASWLSDWSQSKYKLHVVWLIFLASTAVCGSWALRLSSRMEAWINASVVCAFIGTALTLIGLALLPHYGGLEPVRGAWKYGVIAAGQSSIAWILLMHLNLLHRPAAAKP